MAGIGPDEVARLHESRMSATLNQDLPLARHERVNGDLCLLEARAAGRLRCEEHCLSVRQNLRPPMAEFPRCQASHHLRCTTACRDLPDAASCTWDEKDGVIGSPARAPCHWRHVAYGYRSSAQA